MIRALSVFTIAALLATAGSLGGCKAKPSEEACEKAIANVRKITGLTEADVGADPKSAMRSCQSGSSRESVQCMIDATTIEELEKCEGAEGQKYYQEEKEKAEEAKVTEPAAEADEVEAEPAADEAEPAADDEAEPAPAAEKTEPAPAAADGE